jgi:methylated-DNA-[protein]-cysteine S-methyltransferase
MVSKTQAKENNKLEQRWSAAIEHTPVGTVSILVSATGLAGIEFAKADVFANTFNLLPEKREPIPAVLEEALRQVGAYFEGRLKVFDLPLDLNGLSPFSRQVLLAAAEIEFGRVRNYGSLAAAAGHPGAARAVGGVMSRNPIPVVIPCHRVVAANGSLHGFSGQGGLKTKARLLELEGVRLDNLKIIAAPWQY